MELYKKHIDEDGIFHLGKTPYSVIIDIDENGNLSIDTDEELIEEYGNIVDDDDGDEEEKISKSKIYIGNQTSRIDEKPLGKC